MSWRNNMEITELEKDNFLDLAHIEDNGSKTARQTSENKPSRTGKNKRLDADAYFMKIAAVVAERSTCQRHHIGALAVLNKRILATGYNGAPAGVQDCLELGCIRNTMNIPSGERHEICRAVHAEQNVIIQAAVHGVSIEGATIYSTHTPCLLCLKMLANAKIKRFVSYQQYDTKSYTGSLDVTLFSDLFTQTGIEKVTVPRPQGTIKFLD